MSITVHLYYKGENGSARKFAETMEESGLAAAVRAEDGNLAYRYFTPLDDPETVLLIDSWRDQAALDRHHESPVMGRIARLRETFDLHMTAERYAAANVPETDEQFLRK